MTRSDISNFQCALSSGMNFVKAIGTHDHIKGATGAIHMAATTFYMNNKEVFDRENIDKNVFLCGCGVVP